jgi:hypothetical protein
MVGYAEFIIGPAQGRSSDLRKDICFYQKDWTFGTTSEWPKRYFARRVAAATPSQGRFGEPAEAENCRRLSLPLRHSPARKLMPWLTPEFFRCDKPAGHGEPKCRGRVDM